MFNQLISNLDSDTAYVISPDHPYLMSPPDCLIAKNGQTNAYYVIHTYEKHHLKSLLSRLALSRFAFTPNTKHILIIDINNSTKKENLLSKYFDETIEIQYLFQTLTLLKDKTQSNIIEKAMTGREHHYFKYNVNYDLSLMQYKQKVDINRHLTINITELDNVFYTNWLENLDETSTTNPTNFKSKYFHRKNNMIITIPDFSESKQKMALLKKLCLSSLQIDTDFIDGIFHVSNDLDKLVITDNFPIYQYDELKSLRGLAFSGLSLTRAKNEESLDKYFDFFKFKMEKSTYEYNKTKNRHIKRNNKW